MKASNYMNLAVRIAIIPLLALTAAQGQTQEKYDAVAQGKHLFESMGCIVCHSTAKDDSSMKAGPNLYGLFLDKPRMIEEVVKATGEKRKVKADRRYFQRAVRKPWDELAVAESGPTKGSAYPPVMPPFAPEVFSDSDVNSVWHYLRTLADKDQAGPTVVMLTKQTEKTANTLVEIPGEVPVTTRARVFRAPLAGMSGRALYVGFPSGMNFSFDPRFLSVRKIWSGGFLNLKQQETSRAGRPSTLGQGAHVILDNEAILAPLTADGKIVDFEFKDPDVGDFTAVEKYLYGDKDFLDRLAALDADYLGDTLAPKTGVPSFRFRVGKNVLSESVALPTAGRIEITLEGALVQPQGFKLGNTGLTDVQVEGGVLKDGVWTLAPSTDAKIYKLSASFAGELVPRLKAGATENWAPQTVVITPSEPSKKPLKIPAGYSVKTWQPPVDLYGRNQLFEPTGIAVAKDGTIVLTTRTAGVWRIRDGKWSLFAEGTFESLGVWIEDDKGDRIVITQKPELTRIIDSDGDGRADVFETVCDAYGFHGDYHEFVHGPVRDKAGNYYFNLNLANSENEKASWKAGGAYMGSMGGYRGWSCRVTPEGKFEPFASGLRSPAGLAFDPEGRLWYDDNQGEYYGTSDFVPLEKGKFYGHPSSLVDLPGMKPDMEALKYEHWKDKRRKGAVLFPYGILSNSPGNPAWDTTGGKFGPYQGQVFIGDQTLSTLLRIVTENVNGIDQGCMMPFAQGLASGVMRPCFLPDGSLLLGQTGRGWASLGGHLGALQQIVWDGETVMADILSVSGDPHGFDVHFTVPLDQSATAESLTKLFMVKSWFYTNSMKYGSPENDKRDDLVKTIVISPDRLSAHIQILNFGEGDKWLDRIYRIRVPETTGLFGKTPVWKQMEAYFTLRTIPK